MNCKNCEAMVDGKYCASCGQIVDTHRLSVKHVIHDLIHAVTHTDKGILYLLKELLVRPGIVVRQYFEGKRKRYFNPVTFLIITSALSAYLFYQSGYYEAITRFDSDRPMPAFVKEGFELVITQSKLLSLLVLVPFFTIASWLFFRRPKYNLAEHFVLISFVMGQLNVGRIIFILPAFLAWPSFVDRIDEAFRLITLVYMVVVYYQLFRQNIFLTIIKCVFVMIFYIIMYWGSILAFVYVKNLIIH